MRPAKPIAPHTPTRRFHPWALVVIGMLAVGITAVLYGRSTGPVASAIVPLIAGGIIVTELVSAFVLFGHAVEEADGAWTLLAAAYQLSAFLVVPYTITFPHVFAPAGLLGANPQTAVTLWCVWHLAFPGLIVAYALRRVLGGTRHGALGMRRRITAVTLANLGVAGLATLVCTRAGLLPELVHGLNFTPLATTVVLPAIVLLDIAALAVLMRIERGNPTDRWVRVAVVASALDAIMGLVCARYTAGWYVGKVFSFISSSTLVALFIFELRRTFGRLTQANAELFVLQERERQSALDQLDAAEARFRDAQQIAHVGTWEYFPATKTIRWSDETYKIFGVEPGTAVGVEDFFAAVHPEDRDDVIATVAHGEERRVPYSLDHRVLRPDGTVRWVQSSAKFDVDASGECIRVHGAALDITERKEAAIRMAYLAEHDALTKLPNRVLLDRRLEEALAHGSRAGEPLAVLFLDLDNFKNLNDSLGHAAGDRALRTVARRLQSTVRQSDVVTRMGGDEFVVLLLQCGDPSDVAGVAEKIMDAIAEPVVLDSREVYLTASIGVSCYPGDGNSADALIRNADAAMYQAKEAGRNGFRFYTSSMHEAVVKRLELERDLRLALQRGEFSLHYQPFLDLEQGESVRAEALLRWTHPQHGNIPPGDFIPVAEDAGLIPTIGKWVLETALAQLRSWNDEGRAMQVSVNVSMRELAQPSFPDRVHAAIRRHGVPADQLILEVTESTAMADATGAQRVLERCRDLGIRISVDDFGTHYSSLAYLARLPLDALKIDRSFVGDITTSPRGAAIVRAIIDMARSLELSTVAEGVETEEQLRWLREAGCDFGQGFHIARPMPASALEAWLDARSYVIL